MALVACVSFMLVKDQKILAEKRKRTKNVAPGSAHAVSWCARLPIPPSDRLHLGGQCHDIQPEGEEVSYGIGKAGKFYRLEQIGIGTGRIRQAHIIYMT